MSSPEQVLVRIGYSIGRLIAGVVHGRVAVNGQEGVPVHEGHLGTGGLRKIVWVHRKSREVDIAVCLDG